MPDGCYLKSQSEAPQWNLFELSHYNLAGYHDELIFHLKKGSGFVYMAVYMEDNEVQLWKEKQIDTFLIR